MCDVAWPRVSAVIPSMGRPELRNALAGVRAQDYPGEVEAVVVLDGDEGQAAPLARELRADGVTVVVTGARSGANRARNLGVAAASGDLVAYLDDDDEWTPGKTARQVEAWREQGSRDDVVVASRLRYRRPGEASASRPVPDAVIDPGARVEDYLFRRRKPSVGRALLATSTLLAPRALALAVPWNERLRRHQDWDWVTRAQDEGGARFVMVPEALALYATGSAGSISAGADWAGSMAWVTSRGHGWAPGTRADFLAAQALRYALQARSAQGLGTVVRELARTRALPSWQAGVIGAGGLLPRRTFESVVLSTGRPR